MSSSEPKQPSGHEEDAVSHLLVTNDFPPQAGGIQSYLFELWRRLPSGETTVLTTAHDLAGSWDRGQSLRIERVPKSFLAPTPGLVRRVDALAADVGADLVLLDPVWPLGVIGPRLERPYGVILHGAEVTIPARLPAVQLLMRRTLREAHLVIAAGGYPAEQGRYSAGRDLPIVIVPPGVDTTRFHPLTAGERTAARAHFGIGPDALVALGVSRLVPRKGFDVLIGAAARVAQDESRLQVVIAGEGRDRVRLEKIAETLRAPVTFIGRVDDEVLPSLYGCADLFAMLCRNRWLAMEQEGFGIVFLEAGAAGVASVAGLSGGSAEAVIDGVTGLVVDESTSVEAAEEALRTLVGDTDQRRRLGAAARDRAVADFSYDRLVHSLRHAIDSTIAAAEPSVDDPRAAQRP
jgi:phosphatidylinositol alpha-1,6-mannosyltransferase